MQQELLPALVLVALFIAGITSAVNLGALAFVVAYFVGLGWLGMSSAAVVSGFPGEMFVLLVGVTYLFAIAEANGTIHQLVAATVRATRRPATLAWMFFGLTALLSAIGALFAVAIVAPIAMRFAVRYRLSTLRVGMIIVHGALAGAFSPISVYGSFIKGLLLDAQLPSAPLTLFASSFVFNALAACGLSVGLWGQALEPESATGSEAVPEAWTIERVVTLSSIAVLAAGAALLSWNVAFAAMTIAVILGILWPSRQRMALDNVSWTTVLLVTGVLTYVHVLQQAGTIDFASRSVIALEQPAVGALVLCLVGGIVSAFASSVAILGVTVPIAVELVKHGGIGASGLIVALAVAVTVVDVCPFSTNGALIVANTPHAEREQLYRRMLIYSAVAIACGPLLAWAVFVWPGWL